MPATISKQEPRPKGRFRELVLGGKDLSYANFVDLFARIFGDRTLFHLDSDLAFADFDARRVSYNDMARIVARLSRVFRDLGVGVGDRVGIMALNRVEAVFANFAVARLGAVPVPMNFMLQPDEINYLVEDCGARLLVCDHTTFEHNLRGDMSTVPSIKTVALLDTEDAPRGTVALPPLVAGADEHVPPYMDARPDDVATIFYTSGTTGRPKGATLSHDAVTVSLRRVGGLAALGPALPGQLALLVMPVAHSGGYQNMLMNIAIGIPMIFVSRFRPDHILDVIERERPTMFVGSPAMYRMLEDAGASSRDLSSMWVWAGGSDAFDNDLIRRFRGYGRKRLFGLFPLKAFFIRGYGMTEANSYVAITPPFEVEEPAEGETCIGWVLPGVRHRVVDPETLRDVSKGQVGELWLKGVSLMHGYWEDPERTGETMVDGWYRSGDWVREGRMGLLFFVDRAKDVIKCGGFKISSVEIESVLAQHPAIEHVAAIGVPDATKGEVPVAAVTLLPGAEVTEAELLEWAREHIAKYKAPRRIHILAEMPLTFSLKPKKKEVRELLAADDAGES